MKKRRFWILFLLMVPISIYAEEKHTPLEKPEINLQDKASLQRGVKFFINYCSGCHALQHTHYADIARYAGIVDAKGEILRDLVKENLIFTGAKISDPILPAMRKQDAQQWFGIEPPDLSLIVRIRGVNWIYTYLKSFYSDPSRPFGVNNLVFPNVAMPNVLVNLQGIQIPVYAEKKIERNGVLVNEKVIDHLVIQKQGSMSTSYFESSLNDLVNFLTYVSEPVKLKRQQIGIWVLIFVIIFAVSAYLLKSEYWKDIK